MKGLVRKILLIPFVIFLLTFGAFYYFYEEVAKTFTNYKINEAINEFTLKEKIKIKRDVENIINLLSLYSKTHIKKETFNFITKYLDLYNKNRENYIVLGKINTFNPNQDGVFGEIIYMPQKLKNLTGKKLSINKPDIKGSYYREKYFSCLKQGKNCFVRYYFKNPKTGKYEPKISYFALFKPYNWVIVESVYESYIQKDILKIKSILHKQFNELFKVLMFLIMIIFGIGLIIALFISNKISKNILKSYDKLKEEYDLTSEKIFRKIYYDDLTELPNRNKLLKEINKFNSLVLIDLDDFSLINDIYGFEKGDEVLKYVSNLLKHKYQNVYRIGSDEFVIAFVQKITKRFLEEISYIHMEYEQFTISFTIGGSVKKDLLKTSELALKYAMTHRNKKYYLYDDEIYKKEEEYIQQINKIKKVLLNEDVVPYYQCIVDNEGRVIKYEALMRLKVENEIKTPFEFMDLIKKAKIYKLFTRIMVKKVVEDIKNNRIKNVSINLSFEDIVNDYTKNYILSLIDKEIRCQITFEILESEGIENFKKVSDFIHKLKEKNVSIAIDNFGSGHSNFVEVLRLNPDFIKIDSSLIRNLDDKKYFEIVRLIIEFAKNFNIKTIAEFVDSKEKFEKLKEMGIDYFQGYYFCKPVDIKIVTSKFIYGDF